MINRDIAFKFYCDNQSAALKYFLIFLLILLQGCYKYVDYYEIVKQDCTPSTEDHNWKELDENCKNALLKVLDFDSKFENAPETNFAPKSFKDKLLQSFQALFRYPLKFPNQNTIMGVAPGAIPAWHVEILTADESPQKSLFNFVLNQIRHVEYGGGEKGALGEQAHFSFTDELEGKVVIFDSFTEEYDNVFIRAAVLAHEAFHGLGRHVHPCTPPPAIDVACDPDLSSPTGLEVTYLELLLQANAKPWTGEDMPRLAKENVLKLVRYMYKTMRDDIQTLPPGLQELVDSIEARADITPDWIEQRDWLR